MWLRLITHRQLRRRRSKCHGKGIGMLHGADTPNSMGGSQSKAADTWGRGVWVSPRVPYTSWWLLGYTWGLDAWQATAVNIHVSVSALSPLQCGWQGVLRGQGEGWDVRSGGLSSLKE